MSLLLLLRTAEAGLSIVLTADVEVYAMPAVHAAVYAPGPGDAEVYAMPSVAAKVYTPDAADVEVYAVPPAAAKVE